jgi:hypothetical protein
MFGREKFLQLIESNIAKYGYHVTIVSESVLPRFSYSIGLNDTLGFELILAGCAIYQHKDISKIFAKIVSEFNQGRNNEGTNILNDSLGTFKLSEVKPTWSEKMMLGVYDYLDVKEFKGLQIIPDKMHYTNEIPEMDKEYHENEQPVWKWLTQKWPYPVPKESLVTTNIDALKGEYIKEVMRWENDSWEMFTMPGPDVPDEDVRIVSLGTMLGIDESLEPSVHIKLEEGIWRKDKDSDWNKWQ